MTQYEFGFGQGDREVPVVKCDKQAVLEPVTRMGGLSCWLLSSMLF